MNAVYFLGQGDVNMHGDWVVLWYIVHLLPPSRPHV